MHASNAGQHFARVRGIDISKIRYFLAATEHLNYARAALALGVSSSTLSRQIHRVGGELQFKRQLVSGRDRGNAAAKRDNQARQEKVRMRWHVARASCYRASGVRDTRCNNR